MKRFALFHLLPVALVLAAAIAPLASGRSTLVLRDTLLTHLSMREGLARALRDGEIALVDPLRAGGQALLGNPNAVALYPDNALLLVSSTLWQLNAHFWIHWLVAFAAAFALARALGWGAPAAAATAAAYAFSGYFLSQLNLYNGVAPAALAPALAAACVHLRRAPGGASAFVALASLWALSLLGGDPIVAGLALGVAAALALGTGTANPSAAGDGEAPTTRRFSAAALGALVLGSALAAPQLLATRAIFAESSRGFLGFAAGDLGVASPRPAALLDLLLPLFFGSPDSGRSWSNALFGGTPPLYFSLAPGAVALALAVVALRHGGRPRLVPALLAAAGGLGTFSAGTALSTLLAELPGMGFVRFQAKLALPLALGVALLAGLGAERLAAADERARATFRRALAGLAALFALLALGFALAPPALLAPWLTRLAPALTEPWRTAEVRRWGLIAVVTLVALVVARLGAARRWERHGLTLPVAIAVQAALQLVLLRGALPLDEAAFYRRPGEVVAAIPRSARVVHGEAGGRFGPDAAGGELDLVERMRRAQRSGHPFALHAAGVATELDSSPEGLDHFTVVAAGQALARASDAERVRLLDATGVTHLVLPRPLVGVSDDAVRLAWSAGGAAALLASDALADEPLALYALADEPLALYALAGGWGEATIARCVVEAPHMNAALALLLDERFAPANEAVIPGSGAPRCAPEGGAVRALHATRETVEVEVEAPAGGLLVLARAYLPIWRVEIDGRAARAVPAQMTRLAVELPAGARRVRFHVDRTPLDVGLPLALAAALAIALVALRRRGARR